MKLAFVHHGEKLNDETTAPLTQRGRLQIARAADILRRSELNPQKIICTSTRRTLESARIIASHFSAIRVIQKNYLPELWEDWLDFGEHLCKDLQEDHIIVGHHPTLGLLNQQFHLKLSLQSYSSVIILKRNNYRFWSVMLFHQGPTSL